MKGGSLSMKTFTPKIHRETFKGIFLFEKEGPINQGDFNDLLLLSIENPKELNFFDKVVDACKKQNILIKTQELANKLKKLLYSQIYNEEFIKNVRSNKI